MTGQASSMCQSGQTRCTPGYTCPSWQHQAKGGGLQERAAGTVIRHGGLEKICSMVSHWYLHRGVGLFLPTELTGTHPSNRYTPSHSPPKAHCAHSPLRCVHTHTHTHNLSLNRHVPSSLTHPPVLFLTHPPNLPSDRCTNTQLICTLCHLSPDRFKHAIVPSVFGGNPHPHLRTHQTPLSSHTRTHTHTQSDRHGHTNLLHWTTLSSKMGTYLPSKPPQTSHAPTCLGSPLCPAREALL